MYHFHHTKGIIIAARTQGESNRRYRIFTRELGMITASAQGVRLMRSKLRYALQPYALAEVTVVEGKHGWRVTNAVPKSLFFRNGKTISSRREIAGALGFLARFTPENVPEPALFDTTETILNRMAGDGDRSDLKHIRSVLEIRALHSFGYVKEDDELRPLLFGSVTADLILYFQTIRPRVLEAIRVGIHESHL